MKRIKLTQGKFALVDDADFARVSALTWCAVRSLKTFYAATHIGKKYVSLHRFLTETPKGKEVDHLNGDGLDNRRANLRVCDRSINLRNRVRLNDNNTSGATGVTFEKTKKKWRAQAKRSGKHIFLGLFEAFEDAVKARASFIQQESVC